MWSKLYTECNDGHTRLVWIHFVTKWISRVWKAEHSTPLDVEQFLMNCTAKICIRGRCLIINSTYCYNYRSTKFLNFALKTVASYSVKCNAFFRLNVHQPIGLDVNIINTVRPCHVDLAPFSNPPFWNELGFEIQWTMTYWCLSKILMCVFVCGNDYLDIMEVSLLFDKVTCIANSENDENFLGCCLYSWSALFACFFSRTYEYQFSYSRK